MFVIVKILYVMKKNNLLLIVPHELTILCFVVLQADDLPDIPSQTVTEEKYTDEHGNIVVKKVREHSKI